MMYKKSFAGIVLAAFLISTLAVPFLPQRVHAQDPVNTTANVWSKITGEFRKVKDFGLDKIAWIAAKRVLMDMVATTVNWANKGFQGNPFHTQSEEIMLQRIANEQIVNFIRNAKDARATYLATGNDKLPWALEFSRNLVINRTRNTPGTRMVSDFKDQTGVDIDTFQNDFTSAGFGGLLQMTQKDANNPFGFSRLAGQEVNQRISGAQSTFLREVANNGGFIGMKECTKWKQSQTVGATGPLPQNAPFVAPTVSGPLTEEESKALEYDPAPDILDKYSFSLVGQSFNPQSEDCEQWITTTPGTVIASQLGKALGNPMEQLNEADELSELLSNGLYVFFSWLTNKGLSALTSNVQQDLRGLNLEEEVSDLVDLPPPAQNQSWTDFTDRVVDLESELETSLKLLQEEVIILDKIYAHLLTMPRLAMNLDRCVLGPDKGWQDRLKEEYRNRSDKLERNAADGKDGAIDSLNHQKTLLGTHLIQIELAMVNPKINMSGVVRWQNLVGASENYSNESRNYRNQIIEKYRVRSFLLDLQTRYIAIREGLLGLQEQKDLATAALNAKKAELAIAEQELQDLEDGYQSIQNQVNTLNTQINIANQTIAGFQEQLGVNQTALQSQGPQTSGGSGPTLSPSQVSTLQNQVSQSVATVNQAYTESLEKESDLLIQQNSDHALKEARERVLQLQNEIEDLENKIFQLDLAITKLQQSSGKTVAQEQAEIRSMIQQYLSVQHQIPTYSSLNELKAELVKYTKDKELYAGELQRCLDERAEWEVATTAEGEEGRFKRRMVLADNARLLFCNAPEDLFKWNVPSPHPYDKPWGVFDLNHGSCSLGGGFGYPWEDQNGNGYADCNGSDSGNGPDSNYLIASVITNTSFSTPAYQESYRGENSNDIFYANKYFFDENVTDFPRSLTCTKWYRSNLSNYTGIGTQL